MARNTSAIGSGGGKPKPKPKKNPAGFGATPATPKKAAAPNIGAAIERGAKRGRTPPKPTAPKRPGLGATPGRPTAKPTKKLRGLQRETYKSLPVKTRERLIRDQPKGSDISAGIHAERMRAQRAVRAADAYFTTREKKIDKGGRAAQQTLAEKDAVPTNAKDINKGARVVTRQYRRQALKAAVVGVATSGSKAASGRLNHVEKGLSSPDVLAGVGKAMQAIAGGPTRVKKGKGARLATSRSIPLAASREINRKTGNIGSLPVRTAKNTGQVLIESSDARKKLPADAVKAIPASVAGVVGAALDPKRAGKQITEDYARRYKPLVEGNDEEFRQRQKKEGVLPEVLDLSAAVGGGTAIAGRVLNTAGKARYAAGSRSTFARVAGAPRPKLRVAAGDTAAAVRTQEKHANILRNAARHATDAARKRKTEKLAKAPDASPEVRAAAASGGKEVVPLRKSTTKRAQRKAVAREKGSTTYRLKAKQQATQAESETNIRRATRGRGSKTPPPQTSWYHGSASDSLTRDSLDFLASDPRSAVGQGFHLTNDRRAAEWYANRPDRKKHGAVFEATPSVRKTLDLDTPPPSWLKADLESAAREFGDWAYTPEDAARLGRELADAKSGRDAIEAYRGVAKDVGRRNGWSPDDALEEISQILVDRLARRGFDSLLHSDEIAGVGRHRVMVVLPHAGRDAIADLRPSSAAAAPRGGRLFHRRDESTRRAALFYAQQFGIHTPDAARTFLGKRIKEIEAERKKMEADGTKIVSRNDELPVLHDLVANADRYFTSDIAEGAAKQRGVAARAAAEDPALGVTPAERAANALTRTYKPQADLLGIERHGLAERQSAQAAIAAAERKLGNAKTAKDRTIAQRELSQARQALREAPEVEPQSAFIARVAEAARAAGLEQPGYVPSWKRTKTVFSDRAAGGTRAVVPDKSYRGLNVAAGTQEPNPSLLTQQAMKNIKRGENWQLVSRHVENATIDTLPDVKTGEKLSFRNQTIKELNDNLERAGVDPNDVVIVNVGRVRESLAASARKADARPGDPITDPRFADPTEGLSDALEAGKHAATDERYVGTRGFYAFSKAAWKEIEADAKPSGALARSWDVSKGKVSRVLLGNPAWATIQTAANAFQTGMSGTGPVSFVEGQRFARVARRVTPENALRAEAAAGVHKWFDPQQHLGASAHNLIVDEWRAFKEGGLYQVAHKANPLDLIFRYDTMETNAFRRAVFYKNLRKQVYDKMGEDIGAVAAWQQRIGDALMFRSPRERMLKLLEDPEAIYKAAEATNDWLGDFTTRTAAERRILGRATMFYGFLRFSVKLAFYTLPVKHPLRALMLMQLGRLTVDEQKRIFGTEVPNYEIGNYYSPDGDMRLPTQRMNPFANAIQYETPRDIMRFGPPFLQLVLNQRDQSDAFGQTWRLDGKTAKLSDSDKVSLRNRFEVALGEFLRWNPGYRLAEKTGLDPLTGALTGASAGLPGVALGAILGGVAPQKPLEGRQGADSSLIFPQPTKYKPSKKGLPTVQSLLNPPKREPGDVANAKRIDRQRKDRVTARTDYFFPFGTPFTKPTSGKARIAEAKRYAAFKEEKKGKKKAGIPTLSQLLKGK